MRIFVGVILAATILAVTQTPGYAQNLVTCYARSELIAQLEEGFDEHPGFAAVVSDGALLQIYVSASGAWTAIITPPDRKDVACPLLSGNEWEVFTTGTQL